jgi:hypothetical protein
MTPHKWSKEIKAWADGSDIERKAKSWKKWEIDTCPQWNDGFMEFRIKTRHQAVKDAYEAGAKVETKWSEEIGWRDKPDGDWEEYCEYRVKERVFPVTSFTRKQLCDLWQLNCTHSEGLERVANAAIKQYILDTEKLK